MSALRFSRPGIAGTVLVPIDDGVKPHHSRTVSGITFLPLTEAIRPFSGMTGIEIRTKEAKPHKRRALTVVPRCGRIIRSGERCYRRAGHSKGTGCASQAVVERDNARRRTRDFGT